MPNGYTRQDTTGQLANGNPIDADLFNDEYNALEDAMNSSSGHNHDGTTGGGAPINKIGPSVELEVDASAVHPKNDNLIDLGKSTKQWKDGYFGGTVRADDLITTDDVTVGDDLSVAGDATVTGALTVNGNTDIGNAASDTLTVTATIDSNLVPNTDNARDLGVVGTNEWRNIYINGVAYLDEADIDGGNVDGTPIGANSASTGAFTTLAASGAAGIDGDFDINTNKFTVASATGNTAIAGTLAVTGATTMTGALTANGGVAGDVTGDLTGNVSSSGTSNFTTANVSGVLTANGNTVLGNAASDTVTVNADVASNLIPSSDSAYNLGASDAYWSNAYIDAVTTTGNIAVGGNATVTGNLTVQGTTTTVNSTTVDVADKNITVASGAGSSGAADGAGLTAGGANATFTYTSSDDRWNMNKALNVSTVHGNLTGNVTGNVTGSAGSCTGASATTNSISNHDTDNLSEGSSNQYFTTARARAAFSAGTGITITNGTIASTASAANNATITLSAGGGLTGGEAFTTNQSGDETITFAHADTSSAGTSNNSGTTVIQDITLDTYGHITAIGTTDVSSSITSAVPEYALCTNSTGYTASTSETAASGKYWIGFGMNKSRANYASSAGYGSPSQNMSFSTGAEGGSEHHSHFKWRFG